MARSDDSRRTTKVEPYQDPGITDFILRHHLADEIGAGRTRGYQCRTGHDVGLQTDRAKHAHGLRGSVYLESHWWFDL